MSGTVGDATANSEDRQERTHRPRALLERIQPATPESVLRSLAEAKATDSAGVDDIPMSILKKIGPPISDELTLLINSVLQQAEWPAQWKRAEVSPLWKRKGCKDDPASYRPVALLPAIARLTERVFGEQIKQHVRRCDLLPDSPYGFRPEHSCTTALLEIVQRIAEARDVGDAVYVS